MSICKNVILIIILILLFFSFSYSQTWNEHLVNSGIIENPESIMITNDNNQVIIFKIERTVMISVWTGDAWYSNSLYSSSYEIRILSSIIVDTLVHIIVGVRPQNYDLLHIIVRDNGAIVNNRSIGIHSYGYGSLNYDSDQNRLLFSYNHNGLHFIYYNIENGNWSDPIFVDGTPGVGHYNDIAISENGDIWISYYDSNLQDLKVARSRSDGSWDTWFVDSTGDVGTHSQIWIDTQNIAHVAYYDATNQSLKYATFNP